MADVGAAEKRLERAIARLETALETYRPAAPESPAREPENDNDVREEIRNVTVRLDSAIHRLRRALGE